MLTHDVAFLQGLTMFRDVDATKLKLVALVSQRATYRAGDVLLREGDQADTVFVVLEGMARVSRSSDDAEIEIARVSNGAVLGEIGVVLDRPYSATIVAETPLTALIIDKRTFLDLLTQIPQLSMALIRELARRLFEASDLYVRALTK